MRRSFPVLLVSFLFLSLSSATVAEKKLKPRAVPKKPARVTRPDYESDLWVKFKDDLKVKAESGRIVSRAGKNTDKVRSVQQRYGVKFDRAVKLPQEKLDALEARSAQRSGRTPRDIGSGMIVAGSPAALQGAANALLALDEVEYVQFVSQQAEHTVRRGLRRPPVAVGLSHAALLRSRQAGLPRS